MMATATPRKRTKLVAEVVPDGVDLELSQDEAMALRRLIYAHVGGDNRPLRGIGRALERADVPVGDHLSEIVSSKSANYAAYSRGGVTVNASATGPTIKTDPGW